MPGVSAVPRATTAIQSTTMSAVCDQECFASKQLGRRLDMWSVAGKRRCARVPRLGADVQSAMLSRRAMKETAALNATDCVTLHVVSPAAP